MVKSLQRDSWKTFLDHQCNKRFCLFSDLVNLEVSTLLTCIKFVYWCFLTNFIFSKSLIFPLYSDIKLYIKIFLFWCFINVFPFTNIPGPHCNTNLSQITGLCLITCVEIPCFTNLFLYLSPSYLPHFKAYLLLYKMEYFDCHSSLLHDFIIETRGVGTNLGVVRPGRGSGGVTPSGDPRGKGQSPWWGSGGKGPWKPVLLKNLNHNLYSKLIWDYYKMGCVILTRKLFNLPIRLFPLFFVFFFFFFNAEKWCGRPAVAVPTPLLSTKVSSMSQILHYLCHSFLRKNWFSMCFHTHELLQGLQWTNTIRNKLEYSRPTKYLHCNCTCMVAAIFDERKKWSSS